MFEDYGHTHVYSPGYTHVYSPGAEAAKPLGTKLFHKHKYYVHLLISCKFCASNHMFKISPFKYMGDLC